MFSPPPFAIIALLLMIPVTSSKSAWAQNIPSSIDPSRVENQLPPLPKPNSSTFKLPSSSENFRLQAPPGAEEYRFLLNDVVFENVTAYPASELQTFSAKYTNRTVSVSDIYALAADITRKYQKDGYILSYALVPEQEIDGGVVKIRVVEGYISDVDLQGAATPAFPVRQIVADIKKARPLNVHTLERQLLILDGLPGLASQAVLEPLSENEAKNVEAGVRLNILFVPEKPVSVLSVDNYGSKFIGPWQAGVRTSFAHQALFLGESNLAFFLTPQLGELAYLSWSESIPLDSNGTRLTGAVKYSRAEPGTTPFRNLELLTQFTSFSLGLEYPLYLSRTARTDVFGTFEVNQTESEVLSSRFYDDRLRVLRLGGRYASNSDYGFTQGDIILSQGLDILGVRETGSPDLSRAQGRTDFSKIEVSASHLYPLNNDFAISASLSGQYGFSPLLSSEEFGYGGYTFGRAYDGSEITGDSGIALATEVMYKGFTEPSPTWTSPSVEPFAFYDIGKVWNRDNDTPAESGASVGTGVRFGFGNGLLSATVAQPLTKAIANPAYSNGHNPRYLISAQIQF